MADEFEQQKAKNTEAFQYLYDVEVILRELAAIKLEGLHGNHWMKRGLPPDILEKVKNSVTYEKKMKWHRAIFHHPLYYIDFPDLKKILIGGANWTSLFLEIFGQKSGTESSLSELELLRNQIAHNRFISTKDLTILQGIHSKLLSCIPATDMAAARYAAIKRVPVAELLEDLLRSVNLSALAMNKGEPLLISDAPNEIVVSSWWFDECFLGETVEQVKTFAALCLLYSTIPRGIGQAINRRNWVEANDALTQATRAQSAMTALLETGRNFYD